MIPLYKSLEMEINQQLQKVEQWLPGNGVICTGERNYKGAHEDFWRCYYLGCGDGLTGIYNMYTLNMQFIIHLKG